MSATVLAETSVLIIGGGQAGLATSVLLQGRGIPHLVLERAPRVAETWRSGRWDSFTLVTPNVMTLCLPGTAYAGDDPWGFDSRDAVVDYFARYAATFRVPVRYDVAVTALGFDSQGRFRAETADGAYLATRVVLATGYYAVPRIPAFAAALPPAIHQLHTSQYRNPAALPPGGVLVVGSANSGSQIAEELNQAGRTVYLAVGSSTAQVPRRYRGRDMLDWALNCRIPLVPTSNATGKNGGNDLSLHRLARDGVRLLGRLTAIAGETLALAPDLHERLAGADATYARFKADVDDYLARTGTDAPADAPHPDATLRDGFAAPLTPALDLRAAGITTVVWGTGYGAGLDWLDFPVLDPTGRLIHERGVTVVPGLYGIGMTRPVITGQVGVQAEAIVARIAAA